MTDPSSAPSEDSNADDGDTGLSRLAVLWRDSWSDLFKALVISVAFHAFLSLPVVFHPALPGDFEFEWEGRMGELSAIGHGVDDFDDTEEVDWDDMENTQFATVDAQDDDPGDDEAPEEPEEPAAPEEEEEEEEDATAETDDQPDSAGETQEDDEPGEPDEPGPHAPAEDTESETDSVEQPEPPGETTEPRRLPGVERAGPSNLPDMRDYGPGNARVTSLVRTDRLRNTDLEPYVDDLIRAIPDYRIALEGTEFDPVSELDSLFMATARPDILQETFLAARHRYDDEQLMAVLDNRYDDGPGWETDEGRPVRRLVPEGLAYRDQRRLLLAEPGLALIGQPHWFEELMGPVDEDSSLGRELADSEEGASAFTLLDGLSRIEEAVANDEEMLLLVSAYGARLPNMSGLGVDVSDLPVFRAARLAISNAANPELTIDLQMRTEEDARYFEEQCPRLRRQLTQPIGVLSMLQLTEFIEPLECNREGNYVVVEAQYDGERVRSLLDRLPSMLQAAVPPSLASLPPGPGADEPDESTADDAGGDDREDEEQPESPPEDAADQ